MTLVISQVQTQIAASDPPKDWTVNVVHHTVDTGVIWGDPDYQNHANEVRDAFVNGHASDGLPQFDLYTNRLVTVKCYDHGDAKPRPVKATSIHTPAGYFTGGWGPRSIALCLSYYGDRNLPSKRGRIFIGPWGKTALDEQPATNYMQQLVNLGHALFDVGGENVAHCVFSPTHGSVEVVQNYWCNDVWDVIHSRLPKETKRQTLHP
jgi:hypothetical protein